MGIAHSRLVAGALTIALASGLAACGGGGGGGKKDYQASLNTFCGNLLAKQKSLQTDVQQAASGAGTDPAKAATALATVLGEYGSTLKSELATLDKTDVPGDYKAFDDALSKGISQVAEIATTTAGKLKEIDLSGVAKGDLSGLTKLQTALSDLSKQKNPLESLKAPKDLKDGSPKCDELSKAS